MGRLGAVVVVLAAAARADEGDPAGTVNIEIEVGRTAKIVSMPGPATLCDDTSVVRPEFSPDGTEFLFRGLKPGTTLCSVFAGTMRTGVYRFHVGGRASFPDAGPGNN